MGSQAVKELSARGPEKRCILTAPEISAFCRGADCTKGRNATPLDPRSS